MNSLFSYAILPGILQSFTSTKKVIIARPFVNLTSGANLYQPFIVSNLDVPHSYDLQKVPRLLCPGAVRS
jgi:hypothetical protein